jgi:tetratricopeptide (TPR) repeat protein
MAELTQEQQAFLKQRMPENYGPVREPVVYTRDWLALKKMINAEPDPASANLELVGIPRPARGVPISDLQNAVRHACQAINFDRDCVEAYVFLVKAVMELSRYDESILHPMPLREVLPLAQRGKQLGEKDADAWAALIELNIHLKRWDTVTEQLAQFRHHKFDERMSAELSLLAAKGQDLPADEILWYDRLLAMTQESADRAELHGKQGIAYLKLKLHKEADAAFHRAMVEGGPISWVAHEWSMLKDDMGVRPAAIELNRRASNFDTENRAAKAYAELLRAPFRRFGHPFPGPSALEEEKMRGIALAGCDPAVVKANNLKPYEPPKSVTRMLTKKAATRILTKGQGPANISTGEGAISLARSLAPEEGTEQQEAGVGSGYLQQMGDSATLRNIEKEKSRDKKDDSGMLVPRDAEIALPRPATRTIRRSDLDKLPVAGPASPSTRIVRRPPQVPMGIAAQTPQAPSPEKEGAADDSEKEAPPSVRYVRPPTGQVPRLKPSTGQVPALKPPTGQVPAAKPATGQSPALRPATGQSPKPPTGQFSNNPTRIVAPPPIPARVLPIPSAPQAALPEQSESTPALEPASSPEVAPAQEKPEVPPADDEPVPPS